MGSVPPELSLDSRPAFVPKTITSFLKEVSLIGNISDKINGGGETAFSPFQAKLGFVGRKEEIPIQGLTLLTPGIKNLKQESCSTGSRISCSRAVSSSSPNAHLDFWSVLSHHQQQQQQQNARKQRRCWSPELHRRFVNALQQLGGFQAATPKKKENKKEKRKKKEC